MRTVHVTVTIATKVMHHATRTRSDQHVEPIIYGSAFHFHRPLLAVTYKFIHHEPATHTATGTQTPTTARPTSTCFAQAQQFF